MATLEAAVLLRVDDADAGATVAQASVRFPVDALGPPPATARELFEMALASAPDLDRWTPT